MVSREKNIKIPEVFEGCNRTYAGRLKSAGSTGKTNFL